MNYNDDDEVVGVLLHVTKAKFEMGILVATPAAINAIHTSNEEFTDYLQRHLSGDWGDMCEDDKQQNEDALNDDPDKCSRIFSAYHLKDGTKIWIITEWDRSVTTILLPEDY